MFFKSINITNKENELNSTNLYLEIINTVKYIISNDIKNINNNFNTSFELSSIILFSIFYGSKKNKNEYNAIISQKLMNIFIDDLDFSFRELGVGDMQIGKYVKKYVKKFYYRLSKLESIYYNQDLEEFHKFIKSLNIYINFSHSIDDITNIFKKTNTFIYELNNQKIRRKLIKNIVI